MALPDRIGRYEIGRVVGVGAASTVVEAHDTELDIEVAIKILADNLVHRTGFVDAFVREARLLRMVDDRHVVAVHDVGLLPSGQPYLVMDLERGGTLADRLRHLGRPLTSAEARDVADGLAPALEALHRRGLVHGDVKPENVFLRPDGYALGDLGLTTAHDSEVTGGTPGYVAPEQTAGRSVDGRADLFSATALLWRCLTGSVPTASEIDAVTGPLWGRGFATDPAGRPADAAAWLALVRAHIDEPLWRPDEAHLGRRGSSSPSDAGATGATPGIASRLRRRRLALGSAAVSVAAVAAVAAFVFGRSGADPGPASVPTAGEAEPPVTDAAMDRTLAFAAPAGGARIDGTTVLGADGRPLGSDWIAPVAVARIGPDDLVIVDGGARTVVRVRSGVSTRLAAPRDGLVDPSAVAVTADGTTVVVADPGAHCVHRILPRLQRCGAAGSTTPGDGGDGGPPAAATFQEPRAVAFGPDGTLYVADTGTFRVRTVRDGTVAAFAGTGAQGTGAGAAADGDGGSARQASLREPTAVAVDAVDGAVVIQDGDRVRAVCPDGTITPGNRRCAGTR